MIGRTVGRFRILAPLGQGGMASVWRARDELLGREIALKILSESLAQSEDARRRFRHEATIAAQLEHPAIAAVYDSGEHESHTWIAMAAIEGETLAERLARSLVPVGQVVTIAIAVAEALGYAHDQKVVHRDVTSRNVMLARDGRVFVLDFGLALAQGASRVSSSGTTVGTAPYMAPELVLGAKATPGTDLYGLGVVMYEALTGTLPFAGDRPAAMIFARLNQAARPARELRPEMPAALERIVHRCLEREPAARFNDAAELIAALRGVEAEMRGESGASASAAADSAAGAGSKARGESDTARPQPPVEGSTARSRSVTAERLADHSGPAYLAVPEFEVFDHDDATREQTLDLARGMTAAAAAGLGKLQRLHVVPADVAPIGRSSDALRAYARALGVNLLLLGAVRRAGTRVRVTYDLRDPEAGLQIAGDSLEGSSLDPFELEDRVLASLRKALASDGGIDSAAVTRVRPRDPAAGERFQQAARYMERHDHEASVDGAIAILEKLIASEGDVAAYHAALARACLFKYDIAGVRSWEARAASSATRAAELAPDAPETLLALGEVHRVAGQLAEAERELGLALGQRPSYFEAHLAQARVFHLLGRHDEAETATSEAIRLRPEDWRGHSMLGYLRFACGQTEAALEPWRTAAGKVPDNALIARNLGSALFHANLDDDAIAELRRSLDLQPNAVAYTNLGTVLFYNRRYAEAAQSFERGAALSPADPIKWGNLGNALRFTPGRESDARAALERAVGLIRERLDRSPGEGEAWGRLAGWLVNLGRKEEARVAVAECVRLGPDNAHALAHAGHVFCQLGEPAEAMQRLREAVSHGFPLKLLARSDDLASLRSDSAFASWLDSARGTETST